MSGYDDLRDPSDFSQTVTLEQYRRNEAAKDEAAARGEVTERRRVEVAGYSGSRLA